MTRENLSSAHNKDFIGKRSYYKTKLETYHTLAHIDHWAGLPGGIHSDLDASPQPLLPR